MYNYRELFSRTFEQISAAEGVELNQITRESVISPRKFDDAILKRMYDHDISGGLVFPEEYTQILYVGPDSRLDWSYSHENFRLSGILNVFHIASALAAGLDAKVPIEQLGMNRFFFAAEAPAVFINFGTEAWSKLSSDQQNFMLRARYIDANQQLGLYVCVLQNENLDNGSYSYDLDNLWLVQEKGFEIYKLDMSFTDCFELIALTKGAYFWQYLFVNDTPKIIDAYILKYILLMLTKLPIVFPDNDYSVLYSKFDQTLLEKTEEIANIDHQVEIRQLFNRYISSKI